MTALTIPLLTLAATLAVIVAIAEHLDARNARAHARAAQAGTARAIAALTQSYDARQNLADALDALAAMQRSAEGFKTLSASLMQSLEIERAYAARWEEQAHQATMMTVAMEEKYVAAIQCQLRAGFTIVLDHAGRRPTL